jgi:organic hydroperoxide reductase OsmC/OhrA
MSNKTHHYKAMVSWTGNTGDNTRTYQSYKRNYTVSIQHKPDLHGSADSAFRGDPDRYNPEEMLLMAVSSCHMLWFLHLCADNGIEVVEYTDRAEGIMEETAGGGGHFTGILLSPEVIITDRSKTELANALHEQAGKKCFITNSCRFPVTYAPKCTA